MPGGLNSRYQWMKRRCEALRSSRRRFAENASVEFCVERFNIEGDREGDRVRLSESVRECQIV